jgi:hypothetical protein
LKRLYKLFSYKIFLQFCQNCGFSSIFKPKYSIFVIFFSKLFKNLARRIFTKKDF